MVVFYDGWCPMCQGARDRLARLDRRGRLAFRSMREPGVEEEAGVPAASLAARLHVRTRDGRVLNGVAALAAIARELPPLRWAWPFLVAAQRLGVGDRVYDWVARNRRIVPAGGCEEGACAVRPPGG